jgi:hypothetical protein
MVFIEWTPTNIHERWCLSNEHQPISTRDGVYRMNTTQYPREMVFIEWTPTNIHDRWCLSNEHQPISTRGNIYRMNTNQYPRTGIVYRMNTNQYPWEAVFIEWTPTNIHERQCLSNEHWAVSTRGNTYRMNTSLSWILIGVHSINTISRGYWLVFIR